MIREDDHLVVVPAWAVQDRASIIRWWNPDTPARLESGDGGHFVSLDRTSLAVHLSGRPLELGRHEKEVLEELLLTAGDDVRAAFLQEVLSSRHVSATTCRVAVHRLRRALGPVLGRSVATTRGVGYRWLLPVTAVLTDGTVRELHARHRRSA